jgi:hypothetical protein
MSIYLGVNIDHIATLRQARKTRYPSPVEAALAAHDYVADRRLATVVFLSLKLGRPLFLEGEPGTGKTEIARTLAAALGRPVRKVSFRDTRSRWGSCTAKGDLAFSWRLAMAPRGVQEYVAAHEAAHLVEMNHGPGFWRLVARLRPDYRIQRAWLRSEGAGLHRGDRGHDAVVALEAAKTVMLAGVAGNRQRHRAFRCADHGGVTLDRRGLVGQRRGQLAEHRDAARVGDLVALFAHDPLGAAAEPRLRDERRDQRGLDRQRRRSRKNLRPIAVPDPRFAKQECAASRNP